MRTLRVSRVKTRDDVVWVVFLCCGVCVCVCVCVCVFSSDVSWRKCCGTAGAGSLCQHPFVQLGLWLWCIFAPAMQGASLEAQYFDTETVLMNHATGSSFGHLASSNA